MSFVRLPSGILMHVDNHAALVKAAGKNPSFLSWLLPAEPVDHTTLFAPQVTAPASDGGAKPTP